MAKTAGALSGERTETADCVAGLLVGADDYVVKPFHPGELIARVRRLVARSVARGSSAYGSARTELTSRERQVLALLARGLDQEAIAQELVLSPKTVATHIQRILPKLDVRSRTQAVAMAYREGLVADGDGAHSVERASRAKAPTPLRGETEQALGRTTRGVGRHLANTGRLALDSARS